jgi:N-hydroxyarylamine O-acetyltransferase
MFDSSDLDLDAYLARIGYDGRVVPDLETLSALALAHPLAIPFENLDPLLRRPVALDPASLQRKLVHGGRGGWCFEHNLLLGTALRAIGFDVAGLAARVLWMAAPGMNSPRSHMVLLVDVDGQHYVVDAGFGGLTLTAPIRLEADVEQQTPHEPFRLVPSPSTAPGTRPATLPGSGDGFVMEARLGAEWTPLYRFDLLRQNRADYEVTNWYLSNHPQSHFVTGLMAARVERTRRYGPTIWTAVQRSGDGSRTRPSFGARSRTCSASSSPRIRMWTPLSHD